MFDINATNAELEKLTPEEIVWWAIQKFGKEIILSSSFGDQSAVMLHMATQLWPEIPVIVIDTGYFFPETYVFMSTLAQRFKLNLQVHRSEVSPTEMEGTFGKLWETNIAEYNIMRKVVPMEDALKKLKPKVWLTGVRASQTTERQSFKIVEERPDGILKVNPILRWAGQDVGRYMIKHDLPYHPLVEKGYFSIGDWHSTLPGQGREGRFDGKMEECGLHTLR